MDYEEFTLYGGKVLGKFFPNSHRYYINGKPQTGVTTFIGIMDKSQALVPWAVDLALDHLRNIWLGDTEKPVITETDFYEASIQHTIKKQEAASIGDKVHSWIESYVKGENPEMPETKEVQIGVNAFLDWERSNKVKFISSERVVYSKKHGYIGTLDIEAKVNGKLCLIDIKTSNNLYNNYCMQTAAYVKADEEESGKKYTGRWLIRLAKETEAAYIVRMEKKNANRTFKGKDAIDFPPYKVFEAMYLDDKPGLIDRDYKAFLNAKALYEWNKETNFFTNKINGNSN